MVDNSERIVPALRRMLSVDQKIRDARLQELRKVCSDLRAAGTKANEFFCLYCKTNQMPHTCHVCKTSDYLVPNTPDVRKLADSAASLDAFVAALQSVIHRGPDKEG